MCVWNQAYATPDAARDSAGVVQAEVSGCYVLVDPFDGEIDIGAIKANNNQVACYISVGTCEAWRDDFDALKPSCSTDEWSNWEDEFGVLDTSSALPLMKARIDTAGRLGCEWVELDNMDWYDDDEIGKGVDRAAAQEYVSALCSHAQGLGMKCMAKSHVPNDSYAGGTWETSPGNETWPDLEEVQALLSDGKPAIFFHYTEKNCTRAARRARKRYGEGLSFTCSSPGPDAQYSRH